MAQIRQCPGWLDLHPINAIMDGYALKVLDGHHRLEAAKRLRVPICFRVCNEEGDLEPREL